MFLKGIYDEPQNKIIIYHNWSTYIFFGWLKTYKKMYAKNNTYNESKFNLLIQK